MKDEERITGEVLAELIGYPTDRMKASAHSVRAADGAERLAPFLMHVAATPLGELEELYTRTFEINPSCSLEIGWQLFGEQYERGAFLVKMRGLLRQYGVPEATELPDHLSYALRLLDLMPADDAAQLAAEILPAVKKMLDGFAPAHAHDNPYRDLVAALHAIISRKADTLHPSSFILHPSAEHSHAN